MCLYDKFWPKNLFTEKHKYLLISLYIRTGKMHGTRFLSQRLNGSDGAGDICSIEEFGNHTVNSKLYDRIYIYATKAGAIL